VEAFYSEFLPAIGLAEKTYVRIAYAAEDDEWISAGPDEPYNALEFFEPAHPGVPVRFLGVIEDAAMTPGPTRIAFALGRDPDFEAWAARLRAWGARNVAFSAEMDEYPALFFEDPCGTKLEICARRPRG
jgi:hypothetical protein